VGYGWIGFIDANDPAWNFWKYRKDELEGGGSSVSARYGGKEYIVTR
jgi:hypothetical protein